MTTVTSKFLLHLNTSNHKHSFDFVSLVELSVMSHYFAPLSFEIVKTNKCIMCMQHLCVACRIHKQIVRAASPVFKIHESRQTHKHTECVSFL